MAEWVKAKLVEDPVVDCQLLGSTLPESSSVGWGSYWVNKDWFLNGYRIGGQRYGDGVFAHANANITYPLRKKFDVFSACVGLDDSNGACGAGVEFQVIVDGAVKYTKAKYSAEAATCFSLDTTGGETLELSSKSMGADACSEADWVNANLCISEPMKTVDCVVSNYSEFSECTTSCGTGYKTKTRNIVTSPQHGGAHCGDLYVVDECNTHACPVNCELSAWSDYTPCTKSCGIGGEQTKLRSVSRESMYGGEACAPLQDTRVCNVHACPINCLMSMFTPWGDCSQPCGVGDKNKTRTVTLAAAHGGDACPHVIEHASCNYHACEKECVLNSWGNWTDCSQSCGTGYQHRYRDYQTPLMKDKNCAHLHEVHTCNDHSCPIDCEVSAWTGWDTCTKSCGNGNHKRRRQIEVSSVFGGKACPLVSDSEQCNEQCCFGYENEGGIVGGTCQPCAAGAASAGVAVGVASVCVACPAGQYQSEAAEGHCVKCAAGTFAITAGQSSCVQCIAGTFADEGASECTSCAAGKYSHAAWSFCAACQTGQFTNSTGAAACGTCPSGQFPRAASTTCAECPSGKYHPLAYSQSLYTEGWRGEHCWTLSNCAAGEHMLEDATSGSCAACPVGQFKDIVGDWSTTCSTCATCPSGTYRSGCGAGSAGDCLTCAAGQFKASGGEISSYTQTCAPLLACTPGTFRSGHSASSLGQCTACPNGKYKYTWGSFDSKCELCQTCSPGQFLKGCGANAPGFCMGCPSGKYTKSSGHLVCDICPSGQFSFQSTDAEGTFSGPVACTVCEKGTFQVYPGGSECPLCPTGKYNENAGRTSCYGRCSEACPEGKYRDGCASTTKGTCETCAEGKYTIPFNPGCIDKDSCLPGLWRSSLTNTCEQCPGGKFKTGIGNEFCSVCDTCPGGEFRQGCGSGSAGTCEPCALGHFKESAGVWTDVCEPCPAGHFAHGTSSTECEECVKGQFATSPGTPDCELCEKGTIAAAKAATSCTDCDLGTVAIDPGSDECDDCLAGYVSTNNTLPCVECAKGQYQSAVAKTLCVACGPGYFSEVEHSSSVLNCEHCPAGKWSAIATGQCTACDKGKSMTNSTPWVGKTHEGHCENCPAGQFQEADGLTICENCPSGQWQSGTGNHTCRACVHLDSLRFDWTENMAGWKTPCVPHPLHCQHNDWATPSGEVCDKTCGDSGLLLQTRQVTQQEWGGGTACSTLDTQKFVECNRHACPVNCVMGDWHTQTSTGAEYTKCTIPCGGGTQFRTRDIVSEPRFGGASCGTEKDIVPCNVHNCTLNECSHVHCDYTPYTPTFANRTHTATFPHHFDAFHGRSSAIGAMRVRVTHDSRELNGDHHMCHFSKSLGKCQCICSHVEAEYKWLLRDRSAALGAPQSSVRHEHEDHEGFHTESFDDHDGVHTENTYDYGHVRMNHTAQQRVATPQGWL